MYVEMPADTITEAARTQITSNFTHIHTLRTNKYTYSLPTPNIFVIIMFTMRELY